MRKHRGKFVGLASCVTSDVETLSGMQRSVCMVHPDSRKHFQGFTFKISHPAMGFFLEQNWFHAIPTPVFHLLFQLHVAFSPDKTTTNEHLLCGQL